MNISRGRVAVALAFTALLSQVALDGLAQDQLQESRTWHVANNGVDEVATCGNRSSPCRSISQAIANASAGDLILVGPGRYGDLDGDGTLDGVGEESGTCNAAVCVDKMVRILSREGSGDTVIDTTGVASPANGVTIIADDVVFGRTDSGFTVRGANNIAVEIRGARISMFDNIAISNGQGGFLVNVDAFECHLVDNKALDSSIGFILLGNNNRLEFNVAQSNVSSGISLGGNGNHLRNNFAIGNGDGLLVEGSDHVVMTNVIIGNRLIGVKVLPLFVSFNKFRSNNIFGNGTTSSVANLGLVNNSGKLVNARHNYWGSDLGPGPDPADEIFTDNLSRTVFVPFQSEPSGNLPPDD